jgi:hypothetical protein
MLKSTVLASNLVEVVVVLDVVEMLDFSSYKLIMFPVVFVAATADVAVAVAAIGSRRIVDCCRHDWSKLGR